MTERQAVRVVWVLIGHYRRKPSELLGVYHRYPSGRKALDAAAICGSYHEVALSKMAVRG
jgi:hypothetical protein